MITAWLRIHYAIGGTTAFLRMLQKYPDLPDLYRALETRAEEHGLLGRVSPERFFAFDIPQALAAEELCRAYGWRIIPFPSALYPELLRRLKNPPAVLFARGSPERLQNPFRVAVVGTRAATRRAADAAALLGEALSRAGVTVVSGGAYGIDSAAALGAGGVSGAGCVTVLGRGFSPAADAGPAEDNAVTVTELLPGLSGRAFNFPNRNRLIAGMSAGTVVLEAGGKSGSLITAKDALRLGRPVFVPEKEILDSPGCAALAAQGARSFTTPWEVIAALFPALTDPPEAALTRLDQAPVGRYEQSLYGVPGRASREEPFPASSRGSAASAFAPVPPGPSVPAPAAMPEPAPVLPGNLAPAATPEPTPVLPENLSPEARAVAGALADGPRYVDEIIERLGLSAAKAQIAVTELELEDVISVLPGGRVALQ